VEEVQNVDRRESERIAKMKLQATRKRMKTFGILIKAKTKRSNLKRKKMIATKVLKRRNVLPREEESSSH
jgi:hypothetical protein